MNKTEAEGGLRPRSRRNTEAVYARGYQAALRDALARIDRLAAVFGDGPVLDGIRTARRAVEGNAP